MRFSWFNSVMQGALRTAITAGSLVALHTSNSWAAYIDPPSTAQKQSQTPSPKEEWSGVYMGAEKVGYAKQSVEPATYAGKPALKETTHSVLKLLLLGASMQVDENSVSVTDLKSRPLTETFDVTSNGSSIHLVAAYDYAANKIVCTLGEGSGATRKTIAIPQGADLAGDIDFATSAHHLAVGQKFDVYTLNPTTIVLEPIHIEITGREEIVDETGRKVPAFVTKETLAIGTSTVWIDATGETLKGEVTFGPLQIVMTAESKRHALDKSFISPTVSAQGAPAYSPSADLAVITSVSVNKAIDEPRKLQTLHAVLSGIPDKRLIVSDERQRETVVGDADRPPLSADLQITSETLGTEKTLKLPITTEGMSVYLQKAAYLNTEDDGLRKTAMKLRGSETDSYKIALSIRDWVHQNMTPDASIGVPRSASDVFSRRRGVCRDYATLYAALARIAGVPTRLCAGIVYADLDGHAAFYYHAWAESYVGKWVAIDPTLYDPALGIDYVDATHIKFAQGDVTEMYDAVSVVGKLKVSIQ